MKMFVDLLCDFVSTILPANVSLLYSLCCDLSLEGIPKCYTLDSESGWVT
jgi:hypothetical protein